MSEPTGSAAASGGAGAKSAGSQRRRRRHRTSLPPDLYGNYDRWRGYNFGRGPQEDRHALGDPRVHALAQHPLVRLQGATVLDLGCGAGYSSVQIARDYEPSLVVGVDIDSKLLTRARRLHAQVVSAEEEAARDGNAAPGPALPSLPPSLAAHGPFPLSLPIDHGPMMPAKTPVASERVPVVFRLGDLCRVEHRRSHPSAAYDVVLAWNLTKWLHLQQGDTGVLDLFALALRVLKPGGIFVLQAQRAGSYPCADGVVFTGSRRGRRQQRYTPRGALHLFLHLMPQDFNAQLVQGMGFHSVTRLRLPPDTSEWGGQHPVYILKKPLGGYGEGGGADTPGVPRLPAPPAPRGAKRRREVEGGDEGGGAGGGAEDSSPSAEPAAKRPAREAEDGWGGEGGDTRAALERFLGVGEPAHGGWGGEGASGDEGAAPDADS